MRGVSKAILRCMEVYLQRRIGIQIPKQLIQHSLPNIHIPLNTLDIFKAIQRARSETCHRQSRRLECLFLILPFVGDEERENLFVCRDGEACAGGCSEWAAVECYPVCA